MPSNGFQKTLDQELESDSFTADIRVRLLGRTPFFGPGVAQLMELIERCGSVAGACEEMELSYSKGRGMIRKMEQMVGFPVVERLQGGRGGGSARLTPRGRRLLDAYLDYEKDVKKYAKTRFATAFWGAAGEKQGETNREAN